MTRMRRGGPRPSRGSWRCWASKVILMTAFCGDDFERVLVIVKPSKIYQVVKVSNVPYKWSLDPLFCNHTTNSSRAHQPHTANDGSAVTESGHVSLRYHCRLPQLDSRGDERAIVTSMSISGCLELGSGLHISFKQLASASFPPTINDRTRCARTFTSLRCHSANRQPRATTLVSPPSSHRIMN